MTTQPVRLKFLLQERHWQTYRTFCAEYDKVARTIDKTLVGTAPSRPQLHRWLAGALAKLPHPHHCRVLEAMFPGWSAQELFEPYIPDDQHREGREPGLSHGEALPWLSSVLDESVDAVRSIDQEYRGTIAVDLCRKAFEDCLNQLRGLRHGHFDAPFDDNWLVYALTGRTEHSLLATSVEEVDLKWWLSAAGQTYWRLNIEALGRGVQIQRIFVYRTWTDDHEALVRRHHVQGVHTLRVHRDQLSPDLRVDMIMWDELCGYESRVNSSGEAITNSYTFAKQELSRMLERFRMIESCAEEWPPT